MSYKERIIVLLHRIDNEKFLKRIYVSLRGFIKESEKKVKKGGRRLMAKRTEHRESFATEILSDIKRKLRRYQVAFFISLAGNVFLAAVLIFR